MAGFMGCLLRHLAQAVKVKSRQTPDGVAKISSLTQQLQSFDVFRGIDTTSTFIPAWANHLIAPLPGPEGLWLYSAQA